MKTLLGLLICLIILSVLVCNNRFFSEASASTTTNDLNSGDDEEKEEDSGDEEKEEDSEDSGGLGGGEVYSENSGGLGGGEGSSASERAEEISSTEGLKEQENDRNPGEDSGSDNSNGERFRHNAEEIAMELSSLSLEEIKEYPITDLSDKDITLVFRFLDPSNLARVLLNIPQENLVEIQDRLTPSDFNEPLSKISEVDRSQVVDRIVLTSIN